MVPGFYSMVRWQAFRRVIEQPYDFYQNDFAGRIATKIMQGGEAVGDFIVNIQRLCSNAALTTDSSRRVGRGRFAIVGLLPLVMDQCGESESVAPTERASRLSGRRYRSWPVARSVQGHSGFAPFSFT